MSTGQWIGAILGAVVGFLIGGWYGAVYGAIIGYTIGGYIDPVKPDVKQPGAPAPLGLQVMTNVIGNPIFDVLGTAKITGQLLFFGKEYNRAIWYRPSKGVRAISGYKYYASWALGVCMGEADCLYTIFRDQDPIWSGELTRPESGGEATIQIEGMGTMVFYFGTDDQMPNPKTAALISDPTFNTGYRNLCWAFFDACFINEYNRMPSMSFIVRKTPPMFSATKSQIQTYDINPAHALWFVLAKKVGLPEEWLHSGDFLTVATTLFSEGRGISILFDTHQAAQNYLEAINSHVDNILRYGSDGKFHPKLIRYDYTPDDLLVIDESVLLEEPVFSRRSWIDTINEVKVQYSEITGGTREPTPPRPKYLWVSGDDSVIKKVDLDTYAVLGTYTITGLIQGYVGDLDSGRNKLILRANTADVFVIDTNNPTSYYSHSFSGYFNDAIATIISDFSTGYCWIAGRSATAGNSLYYVYDYVNDVVITSFSIPNSSVPAGWNPKNYGGSIGGSYVYIPCGNGVGSAWALIRINKQTYAYNYLTFGNNSLYMRHSIYDNHLYVAGTATTNWKVYKINLSTFTLSTTLTTSGTGYYMEGMALDINNARLFVAQPAAIGPYNIYKFDLSTFTEVSKTSNARTIGNALVYDSYRNLIYNGVDGGINLRVWNPDTMTYTDHDVGMYIYGIYIEEEYL